MRKVLRLCWWRFCFHNTSVEAWRGGNSFKLCPINREVMVRASQRNRARPSKRRGTVFVQAMSEDGVWLMKGNATRSKRCNEADLESRDKARVNTLASSGDDEGGLSSSLEQSWENIAVGKVRERQSFKSRAHEFCTPLVYLAAFHYPITPQHAGY